MHNKGHEIISVALETQQICMKHVGSTISIVVAVVIIVGTACWFTDGKACYTCLLITACLIVKFNVVMSF